MWTDGEGLHKYKWFNLVRVTALKTHASAPSQGKQSNTQTMNKSRDDSLRNNEAICTRAKLRKKPTTFLETGTVHHKQS